MCRILPNELLTEHVTFGWTLCSQSLDKFRQSRDFIGTRRPGQRGLNHVIGALLDARRAVRYQAVAPLPGHLDHKRIIQHGQRLIGHVRHIAAANSLLGQRLVEECQESRRLHQRHFQIDAAPTVPI